MAEIKRLAFAGELMVPSLDGSKRFTVRKYREGAHDFSKDEIVIGEFKGVLNILLHITADTKKGTLKSLKRNKKEINKNGYYFDAIYFEELKQYYTDLTWDTMGAIVFFEVLKVNGVSVVSVNEQA